MDLPLREQKVHDVYLHFQGLGQRNELKWGSAGRWLSNLQSGALPDGNDLRDWSLAIEYRDGLAAANCPQVFAEMRLEFRDPYLPHDLMMTIYGPLRKKRGLLQIWLNLVLRPVTRASRLCAPHPKDRSRPCTRGRRAWLGACW